MRNDPKQQHRIDSAPGALNGQPVNSRKQTNTPVIPVVLKPADIVEKLPAKSE